MNSRKIFVLLADGIGLKNFVYSEFATWAEKQQLEVIYWNATKAKLAPMGLKEVRLKSSPSRLSDLLKNVAARKRLNRWSREFDDDIYLHHIPQAASRGFKKILRTIVTALADVFFSEQTVAKLMVALERRSGYYRQCKIVLEAEMPAYLLCTNQRQVISIAPVEAAKSLGIPCGTFIFSWDNLPKATVVIRPDHYFVWSAFMKSEFGLYYPEIPQDNVIVTGTPQFENHYAPDILSREAFCDAFGLDPENTYICYSGDDVKTSPFDPEYLSDLSDAVRELNNEGSSIGILFRRCPVDTSSRFDEVLKKNADIITVVDPLWKKVSSGWDGRIPTKEDLVLQAATISHSALVVNLGSSMVFDAAAHGKPCAYMNYDVKSSAGWSVNEIYRFVHFQSMPQKSVVLWLNAPSEIAAELRRVLTDPRPIVTGATQWFQKIVAHPPQEATQRLAKAIYSKSRT